MPVYHITLHAYGSWMPDHPRGYVQRGSGIQPTNPEVAVAYRTRQSEQQVTFDHQEQEALAWIAHDICQRRGWRLHGIALDPSHLHLVMSWRDETPLREVFRKLKNLMSRELGLQCDADRQRWFVRGGSKRRVSDESHFEHLMNTYLPEHRGLVWREGDPPPESPTPVGD